MPKTYKDEIPWESPYKDNGHTPSTSAQRKLRKTKRKARKKANRRNRK